MPSVFVGIFLSTRGGGSGVVILNVVKDLSVSTTFDRLIDLEMFRFAQHDVVYLFAGIFLSTREGVG